ncbi:MAG TPA: CHAD domain-containing protein [Gaiellaceae bacterium]|nr:CHAD domain-containing protein [Gaiellaceae bacterium]
MARAHKVPGLNGNATFGQAAASAVQVRSQEVFAFGDGVLDTGDPDGVHDMRVATRRLRAALEIFAPCFPKDEQRALLREVKALADALGERRDPDVQIEALEKLKGELGQGERTGVNGLVAELRARQRLGNERLEEALERAREARLAERLEALAETVAQ